MRSTASLGIVPCSAQASQTAISTWSQRSHFPSSDQMRAISGREERSVLAWCPGPGPGRGVAGRRVPFPLDSFARPAANLEADAAAGDVAHLLVLVLMDGHRGALGDGYLDDSSAVAAGQGAAHDAGEHL